MFDQTFVDGAGKTNKSWTVTLSFLAEFAAIGAIILVPLLWTEVLPKARFINALMAPAPAPPPPAPAPVIRQVRIAPRVFNGQALEAQRETQLNLAMIGVDDTPTLPNLGLPNLGDEVSGVPGVAAAGVFSSGAGIVIAPPPPSGPKAEGKPKPEKPLAVGGKVQSAKLIKHPAPAYPAIAKSARIQGTVVLQAIIGKNGAVENLRVVSAASPLLVASAMDAVKQWVYQPTLLNQEPVEVITEITVIFALQ